MIIPIPKNIPWRLLGVIAAIVFLVSAAWFFIVQPRIDNANLKADAAQLEARRLKRLNEVNQIIVDEQNDIIEKRSEIVDDVKKKQQPIIEREKIIREKIIEKAIKDGDPQVSDGMQEFLKEISK